MEMGTTMGGLQSLGAPWATFYHSDGFPHTPASPKPLPRQAWSTVTMNSDDSSHPSSADC